MGFDGESATDTATGPASERAVGDETQSDYDCGDFDTQADAQEYLPPDDPYRLDSGDDGEACESLP